MISKTFTIAQQQLPLVELKLAAMNKKAAKLGLAPAVISSSHFFIEEVIDRGSPFPICYPRVTLTVDAEELRFGDYTFVAALDHSIGQTPIVKSSPNEVVPELYFTAVSTTCEHCFVKRHRNNTYVFRDLNGYKQVGSTCLKEFFGIDPTKNLDWFGAFCSFDEEFDRVGRDVPYEHCVYSIALAMAITAKHGFVSRKASSAYHEASGYKAYLATTSDLVLNVLTPGRMSDLTEAEVREIERLREEALTNMDAAKALIAWGVEHFSKESGEYAHNMTKFLSEVAIPTKYMGYLVSVIAAKKRFDNVLADKLVKVEKNEFVGSVGAKVTLTVKVNKVVMMEGNYGITYVVIMSEVETGNNLVWFASVNSCREGETCVLKGTVKAHNVRDNKNQTALTRCKVLEVLE